MQFRLTTSELQLLVDILEKWDSDLSSEIARTESADTKSKLARKRQLLEALENMLITQDLQFSVDEFDLLAEAVSRGEMLFTAEMARANNGDKQETLRTMKLVLQRIREKLTEACTMF